MLRIGNVSAWDSRATRVTITAQRGFISANRAVFAARPYTRTLRYRQLVLNVPMWQLRGALNPVTGVVDASSSVLSDIGYSPSTGYIGTDTLNITLEMGASSSSGVNGAPVVFSAPEMVYVSVVVNRVNRRQWCRCRPGRSRSMSSSQSGSQATTSTSQIQMAAM